MEKASEVIEQLLQSISEMYLHPAEGTADSDGHMKLNILADEFGMTWMKVRKLLITAGVYENPISNQINALKTQGKTIKEIQAVTGLSNATICGYLPYEKVVYNMEQQSDLAERLKRCRKRKKAVEHLSAMVHAENEIEAIEDALWDTLWLFEGYLFHTVRGNPFHYHIKGKELFIDRKEKSVTKATINMALKKVLELQKEKRVVTGPKMIGCFGDSYLFSVFVRIGIIQNEASL
uniref:hypothetical protein n=1 Tax=Agathobacter sp. TaxID=2021311 RepID=UPI004055E7A0